MADIPYGITLATFYTGHTGMRLQAMGTPGKDALILGGFLTANEWANMIGLYELSPTKLTRCLPSVKGKALTKAFDLLAQEQYAFYDEPTEFVWVREMARIRLRIEAGKVLANTNALKGAQNLYQRLPLNPFLGPFFDRYHVELALKHRRQGPSDGVRTVSGESSKGVRTGSEDRLGDQRSVLSTQVPVLSTQESTDQVSERTAAPPQRGPAEDPDPNDHYAVITALVTKDILPLRLPDEQLMQATLDACKAKRILHNVDVVRKAIDSALFRYYRLMRQEHELPPDPRGSYRDGGVH